MVYAKNSAQDRFAVNSGCVGGMFSGKIFKVVTNVSINIHVVKVTVKNETNFNWETSRTRSKANVSNMETWA